MDKNKLSVSNREYKSSMFTTYFGTQEKAAELYGALHHISGIKPEDIVFETLQGVIYLARKNDMAFTVGKKVLVIGEHQSTINKNMPLRNAIYYGRTMERLIPPRDIYRSSLIPIPTPEFYMFYNGNKPQPTEQLLQLSDAYLEKSDNPMLELTVKVININPSAHHPILQECRSIYEYSWFVQRIRDYTRQGDSRDSAIQKAMADCIQHGIMVDFIQVHGSEVRNMLFTEFNLEDALEVHGQECYDEGKLEGQERVNSLIKLLLQNKRFSDVEKAVEDSAFQQQLFQEFHL